MYNCTLCHRLWDQPLHGSCREQSVEPFMFQAKCCPPRYVNTKFVTFQLRCWHFPTCHLSFGDTNDKFRKRNIILICCISQNVVNRYSYRYLYCNSNYLWFNNTLCEFPLLFHTFACNAVEGHLQICPNHSCCSSYVTLEFIWFLVKTILLKLLHMQSPSD